MNIHSYVSVNELLADITPAVGDIEYKKNTRGFYVSQIQQALERLAFDTFFDVRTEEFPFPSNLRLEMPANAFNVRQIYLFNGDTCDVRKSVNVWWKRDYFTGGKGYLARSKDRDRGDPFYDTNLLDRNRVAEDRLEQDQRIVTDNPSSLKTIGSRERHFFYNIQNGIIMFSSYCRHYQKVALVFNGTGTPIGDIPVIPLYFRTAVKDYVCEVALRTQMATDARVGQLWKIYEGRLNGVRNPPYDGSWYNAEKMVKSGDSKAIEDLKEYLSRGGW